MTDYDPFDPNDKNIVRLSDWLAKRHRTPQSTIDAFWYLVRLNDPDRLKAWLEARPQDQKTLIALYEDSQDASA